VLQALRHLTDIPVPADYVDLFIRARLTFRHHLVFDPDAKVCVPVCAKVLFVCLCACHWSSFGAHHTQRIHAAGAGPLLPSHSSTHTPPSPPQQAMVPLTPFQDCHVEMDLSFLGVQLTPDLAEAVALGRLHPHTHRPYTPPEEEEGGDMEVVEGEGRLGDGAC
jgi:hypothetical protein